MRTTITIDDRLLAELRRKASETGTTISRLIEEAVRLSLHRPEETSRQAPYEPVTFGAGGRFSRYDIDKASALLELDDMDNYRRR